MRAMMIGSINFLINCLGEVTMPSSRSLAFSSTDLIQSMT